ncbi:unnamed protein product [Spirodela intermedia]|uniref:Uncharacterized protein n=1 Tax=Spirodela intermedia TaxID=51605 RepID=A0A7I8L8A9_SPIIN|nr:unnamed protein product [Spirodela intermedia]
MATARPSSAILKLAALLMALAVTIAPAAASQLNLYTGVNCSGSFTACFDRACCVVPSNAVSYRFYYNPSWKAYFYGSAGCTGSSSNVLAGDVICANGVNFRSAFLTDTLPTLQLVTEN